MKIFLIKFKQHIVTVFFAILVGFVTFAPFDNLIVGVVGAAGLALMAFLMVEVKTNKL
jgi:hypothetical protein